MTRVLFLTESFHPVLGGGETHIRVLSQRLVAAGLACTVVTRRSDASWPAEEDLGGVRVVRVPPSGSARLGKYLMVRHAVGATAREPFDVLVVRGTRVLGLPGYRAARRLGRPVVLQPELNGEMTGDVYTWGTPFDRAPWRSLVRGMVSLRNRALRHADGFVAMSREIRDEFLAAGAPAERVSLFPHGVDTGHFRPPSAAEKAALRGEMGLPPEAVVVAWTGRLLRGKGLEVLVDAFARVAASDPRLGLLLVGSGQGQALSIEEALRADVARRGLDRRVTFTGRVDDVAPFLRAADLFAFPSVYEALGISLVEAAACGLPCIGSRTGGIVDVVEDGHNGLLVEPGDVDGLAAALAGLAGDVDRRAELGAGGRKTAVERFDLDRSVGCYRQLFVDLSSRTNACSPARAPREGAAPPR